MKPDEPPIRDAPEIPIRQERRLIISYNEREDVFMMSLHENGKRAESYYETPYFRRDASEMDFLEGNLSIKDIKIKRSIDGDLMAVQISNLSRHLSENQALVDSVFKEVFGNKFPILPYLNASYFLGKKD